MAQFSLALRSALAGQIGSTIGTGGTLKFYTGTSPGVANSPTGTLLTTLTAVTFTNPANGTETFTATQDSSAAASGTPGYGRLATSAGVATIDFTAGVGSGEASFNQAVSAGGTVSLTSAMITMGNA